MNDALLAVFHKSLSVFFFDFNIIIPTLVLSNTNLPLMKKFLLPFFLSVLSVCLTAQEKLTGYSLILKSGIYAIPENLDAEITSPSVTKTELVNGNYYRFIQFYHIPTDEKKKEMETAGIKFLSYTPANAYISSIPVSFDLSLLKKYQARSIAAIKTEHKLSFELLHKDYPQHARIGKDKIELNLVYFPDVGQTYATENLKAAGAEIISARKHFPKFILRIAIDKISALAALPFVQYIEPVDSPAEPEDLLGRTNHRSHGVYVEYGPGRKYDGTGVNVMLQDDGLIGPHIDYQGRIGFQTMTNDNGNHGDHCGGIIMGAGNINPTASGMAQGAQLFVYNASGYEGFDSIYNHYSNPGIVISSTSYGQTCNGGYTSIAQELDMQTRTMPTLIHVFSAGNSGTSDCGYGAGSGWGNITGGHKQGKNVIAVGNLTSTDGLASSSSRGPAADGRIKPDVCAVGTNVNSTMDPNSYQLLSGTSMACPGVAGTMAQLYHAYKSLNGNQNPPSSLMKAIIMNSADDLGNAGPDFRYGYGRINGLRAVKYIEDGRFISGTISQNGNNTHNITVPANTAQLRVMLYWHDYEGAVNANPALVNNLNMVVTDPSSASFNPWVLNSAPNATTLNQAATRQVDNLNNVEQVTIDNPQAGVYTVSVSGATVPQGPQQYYIVYEFVEDKITVIYPNGGEGIAQSVNETIRWDAFGSTGNFTVELSTDNGATWFTLSSTVPGTQRYYSWTPASSLTTNGQSLIRVSRNSISDVSDGKFSIIRIPTGLNVDTACPTAFYLKWNAVTGATGYEVSMLGQKYMDSVGVTTNTGYWFTGISSTNTYWVSVRALGPTNARGRRAIAEQKTPGTWGSCVTVDVNDLTAANGFSVYPNPASEVFNVRVAEAGGNLALKLTDVTGREVYSQSWQQVSGEFNTQVNIRSFASGIYSLELTAGDKQYRSLVSW